MRRLPAFSALALALGACATAPRAPAVSPAVAAVLAGMPAADSASESRLAAELLAQGEPAVLEVCGLLVPAGAGDDVSARYALSGLSARVTRPGAEAEQAALSATYVRALEMEPEAEVRAFLVRQLQLVGDAAAVPALARQLEDPALVGPAARALEAIGGRRAEGALLGALPGANDAGRVALVQALGSLRSQAAAYEILKFAVSDDADLRQVARWALANIGPVSPGDVLLASAEEETPYRRAQADAALLLYAQRLVGAGQDEEAREVLLRLLATLREPGEQHTRRAALDLLLSTRSGDAAAAWRLAARSLDGDTEADEGFTTLFNGRDLSGWTGDTVSYAAEDGVIAIHPGRRGGGGNLYTEAEYDDFVFRFEFRLTPGANNGLGIRAPLEGDAAYVGMELQIIDNTAERYAGLHPYQYHGSIYGTVPARRGYLKPVGEWNSEEVIAVGRHVIVILNGAVIVDADLDVASTPKTMDGREHPGLKRSSGHIGFLGHGSKVEFRDIAIRTVDRRGR